MKGLGMKGLQGRIQLIDKQGNSVELGQVKDLLVSAVDPTDRHMKGTLELSFRAQPVFVRIPPGQTYTININFEGAPAFEEGNIVDHETLGRGVITGAVANGQWDVEFDGFGTVACCCYGEDLTLVPDLQLIAEQAPDWKG